MLLLPFTLLLLVLLLMDLALSGHSDWSLNTEWFAMGPVNVKTTMKINQSQLKLVIPSHHLRHRENQSDH